MPAYQSTDERITEAFNKAQEALDAALWCCEQMAAMSAAVAAFKFKKNSSYWPEYCQCPIKRK